MSSISSISSRKTVAVLTVAVISAVSASQPATGQTARVQFIHASPYTEVQSIDVYRNGTLWQEDFAYLEATPFENWPMGSVDVSFRRASEVYGDGSGSLFSDTLTLTRGERYIVIAAGDPLNQQGQPPFDLFVMDGAHEKSYQYSFPVTAKFNASPDAPPAEYYWRTGWQHLFLFGNRVFGDFETHQITPTVTFDIDIRVADGGKVTAPFPHNLVDEELQRMYGDERGSILSSVVYDASTHSLESAYISLETGFVWPRSAAEPSFRSVTISADGSVVLDQLLTSPLQIIHDAPYGEVESVDVYINGFLVVEDLTFRRATPYIELPAGLEDSKTPTLKLDIVGTTISGGADTLYSKSVRLGFGRTYVGVLGGDPLGRDGEPAMDLFLFDRARETEESGLLFFHGAPDVLAVNVGIEGEPLPLVAALGFGAFSPIASALAADDTLYVTSTTDRSTIALFEVELTSEDLADSSVVVLTSGFSTPPGDIAAEGSEFELLAALPSGGPLLAFAKEEPPPWWQQPFYYLIGLVGLAVVVALGSQLRMRRLEAHAQELSTLVEERTHELRLEKEKTEEQARRLSELDEAKNRFFANISHEFRTPLTLILGPLQDAIDGGYGKVAPALGRQFQLMRRSGRRLLRLVNQLLDLSRLDSGKMDVHLESGDLVTFLQELVRVFMPMAERRQVSLSLNSGVESIPGEFDFDHLEKIFANLISNALKFTPAGGVVAVTTELNSDVDKPAAEVSVKDNGPGIPAEHLDRIFDRFQQAETSTRRTHEGSGVGLTLARELAELNGGSLVAESTVGEGSRFVVALPVRDVEAERDIQPRKILTAVLEEPLVAPQGDGLDFEQSAVTDDSPLILVVEDNADVREYLRSHLSNKFRLIQAENGEEGLAAAQEHRPDLILSDIMMPVMDGYEMCRLIKANPDLRHIPIVMLTAKATERDTLEGLESGADDYIQKPFSVNELMARVSNFIVTRHELREKYSRAIIVKPGDIEITSDDEIFLDSLLEVVNGHLGDTNFSVDWLADEMSISRRQLERQIKTVTGQSPADLVRTLRLLRASQLLRAQAGTVSEIAYSVGFRSVSHFSNAFSRMHGQRPSEYAGDSITQT